MAMEERTRSEQVVKSVTNEQQGSYNMSEKTVSNPVQEIIAEANVGRFSIERSKDNEKPNVNGILVLSNKIIISDYSNRRLKVFNLNGAYLSSIDSRHWVSGIAKFSDNKFMTRGPIDTIIRFWKLQGNAIKRKDRTYNAGTKHSKDICYNGTYICLLHSAPTPNAITVLDTQGRQVREIAMEEAFGKKISFGDYIHMDSATHNLYVPCVWYNFAVLCISVEGEPMWSTPITGHWLWEIVEIQDVLCVAVSGDDPCLRLLSKSGECMGKLLTSDVVTGKPKRICYDDINRRLYFSIVDDVNVYFVSLKVVGYT